MFVLTHHPRAESAEPRISFVADGIEAAVATAHAAAGDKDVGDPRREPEPAMLEAGLLDEIVIQLAPVLLGGGVALYGDGDDGRVELERIALGEAEQLTGL